jgi:hypothetical protein
LNQTTLTYNGWQGATGESPKSIARYIEIILPTSWN